MSKIAYIWISMLHLRKNKASHSPATPSFYNGMSIIKKTIEEPEVPTITVATLQGSDWVSFILVM